MVTWKRRKIDNFVETRAVSVISWSAPYCPPCNRQDNILKEIKKNISGDQVSIESFNYNKHKKKAKKMGVKPVLPAVSIFVHGQPMTFKNLSINPDDKGSKVMIGCRQKTEYERVIRIAIEKALKS